MPRPKCKRRVGFTPKSNYFKPNGIPMRSLEEIDLRMDEMETIRLSDYHGLSQEKAAEKMDISQPTFFRILNLARKKIAQAIIEGKAIKINENT